MTEKKTVRGAFNNLLDAVGETVGDLVEEARTNVENITEGLSDAIDKANKYQPSEADRLLLRWYAVINGDNAVRRHKSELDMICIVGDYLDPITNGDGTFE